MVLDKGTYWKQRTYLGKLVAVDSAGAASLSSSLLVAAALHSSQSLPVVAHRIGKGSGWIREGRGSSDRAALEVGSWKCLSFPWISPASKKNKLDLARKFLLPSNITSDPYGSLPL
jgi:hypothetical protein